MYSFCETRNLSLRLHRTSYFKNTLQFFSLSIKLPLNSSLSASDFSSSQLQFLTIQPQFIKQRAPRKTHCVFLCVFMRETKVCSSLPLMTSRLEELSLFLLLLHGSFSCWFPSWRRHTNIWFPKWVSVWSRYFLLPSILYSVSPLPILLFSYWDLTMDFY